MKVSLMIAIILGVTSQLQAIDLEKAVTMLEATGDFEAAEPVAFKLTQKKKEHYYRIEFLRKYPQSDFSEVVYLQTWRDIRNAGNMSKLRSFIKTQPSGPYSLDALDKLLDLYQEENTILGYREFLKNFPNSPQAPQALEGIFKLAFERATKHADKLKSVTIYDEYIHTFPTSPYLPAVIKRAEELEYQSIVETLGELKLEKSFSDRQQQKETIARKLYNEMRQLQRNGDVIISQRKYNILQNELFIDTVVLTELMDREETQAYRKAILTFQKNAEQKLVDLQTIYREESDKIRQIIASQEKMTRQTIASQEERTRQTIASQGSKTRSDIAYLGSQVQYLSYEKGRLADAVNEQTARMEAEARQARFEQQQRFEQSQRDAENARYAQERLFVDAQEQAQRMNRHNLDCAENLAKNGKYSFWSGCP